MSKVMVGIVAPIARDGTIAPATPIYREIPNAPEDPYELYPFEDLEDYFAKKYRAFKRAMRTLEELHKNSARDKNDTD